MGTEESTELIVFPRGETPYQDFVISARGLVEIARRFDHINSKADAKLVTDHLGAISDLKKALMAFKSDLLAPLKKSTGDVNDAINEVLELLVGADKWLRDLVLHFNEEEREKVRQAEDIQRKEAELAALKGEEHKPAPIIAPAKSTVMGEHTQSSERMIT